MDVASFFHGLIHCWEDGLLITFMRYQDKKQAILGEQSDCAV